MLVELRQLAYVEAVARCGGFTRAAEDLRVAQPAISAQVRRLERELGVALFTRTTRRVTLTEAGELVLARARRVQGEIEAVRHEVADVAAVVRGRVVVGATGTLGGPDLPTMLAGFARRHPGVALSVRSGLVDDLLRALDDGSLDLVLGPLHPGVDSRYAVRELAGDRLVLIGAPGRLPGSGPVGIGTLRDEVFACLPAHSGLRTALATLGSAAGFEPDVRFEAETPREVVALVAAGLGVALMAESAAREVGAAVERRDLRPTTPHPPFGVVHREPLGPAARALHRHLLLACGREG